MSKDTTNIVNEYKYEEELKNKIMQDIITPTYLDDLQNIAKWRKRWRKIGNITITLSKLLAIIGSITAFTDTYFKEYYFSVISGILTLMSVLTSQYSEFSYKESSKRTQELNEILESINMNKIPDISDNNNKQEV